MPALRAPPMPQPNLSDRIAALRAEIDLLIDQAAADTAVPGVPLQVTRNLITAQGGSCHCRQYLILESERLAAASRAKLAQDAMDAGALK